MANCNRCGRRLKKGEKRSTHICDLVLLSDGRTVHADLVRNPESEVRKEIEAGKISVEASNKPEVVKPVGDRFNYPLTTDRSDK